MKDTSYLPTLRILTVSVSDEKQIEVSSKSVEIGKKAVLESNSYEYVFT